MELTINPRGVLVIDNIRICYKNFSGVGSAFNREGDRNFGAVIENRELREEELNNVLQALDHSGRRAEIVSDEYGSWLEVENGTVVRTWPEALRALGWNIKRKDPSIPDGEPFFVLTVKIKFTDRGPNVYLRTSRNARRQKLSAETIFCLDRMVFEEMNMDIRPYDWELAGGKTGRTAYLSGGEFIAAQTDRFADKEEEEDDPF